MASSSFFFRTVTRSSAPLVAVGWPLIATRCDAGPASAVVDDKEASIPMEGFRPDEKGDYHGMFPRRQLWQPKLKYPLWDRDWDAREPPSTGDKEEDRHRLRDIRNKGTTRHIILVRHGQYDESSKEDAKRKLTELGRLQAEYTGKRLAEMMKGAAEDFGPCRIKALRVSGMTRARETAEIIAKHLPGVEFVEPDPLLNEGR